MEQGLDWSLTIGAEPLAGGVRFRVWAPTADRVEVLVHGVDGEVPHPMTREEGGYHSAMVAGIGAGARYRFRLNGGDAYPDPASRSQPEGVHAPSEVVDPAAYAWRDAGWQGIRAQDLILYELHTGTFSPEGTFAGAVTRLDSLVELGVTAIEVMPIAAFAGDRNWGYDGVNLFAPAASYGGVEGFKRLVDEAHARGLAVVLDVVYNHLGPEGNYIPAITGGRFFTDQRRTPWGDAVNVDGPGSHAVRDFILQNALYWFHEYHVDGLRLDATHAILDDSDPHILRELAIAVRAGAGRPRLLIAEDERNDRRLVLPPEEGGFGLDAVWADDLHHQLRRFVAGDQEGYFALYRGTVEDIATTLRQGWWRTGSQPLIGAEESEVPEGTPAEGIPPFRFVHCIQNHDQVGNRALGERLHHEVPLPVYRAASALLLLSPYIPLLWMGQEWAASSPFLYFTDHPDELGRLVTAGRRQEFRHFSSFQDPERRAAIPDPQAPETFLRSRLDWAERGSEPHRGVLALYAELLQLRRTHPALRVAHRGSFEVAALGEGVLALRRTDGSETLLAVVNLRGEIQAKLDEHAVTRPPAGRFWAPRLVTEEQRFGGDPGWGRYEAEGLLHLMEPVAVLLEATS
jgi:maltooligosyltrehalose trehalohydrolase